MLSANAIAGNGGLGIDLQGPSDPVNGVTPNDDGDGDSGPDSLQNFPVITSIAGSTINGSLNSIASTTFKIEFFASPTADPSGFGEGQTFLGSTNATTGSNGNATFAFTSPTSIVGKSVTATATLLDAMNNPVETSEFSAGQLGPALPPTVVNSVADTDDGSCDALGTGAGNKDCTLREAINATNATVGVSETITFNIPGTGVKTISPATPLPNITDPVTIDGYSQPGSKANTLTTGSDAILLIELNGTNAGNAEGLSFLAASSGSTVRGLVINRFSSSGISLVDADNNTIAAVSSAPTQPAQAGATLREPVLRACSSLAATTTSSAGRRRTRATSLRATASPAF